MINSVDNYKIFINYLNKGYHNRWIEDQYVRHDHRIFLLDVYIILYFNFQLLINI